MSLIHLDQTGIIAWHFATQGTAGDTVVTLGYDTPSSDIDSVALKAFAAWADNVQAQLSAHCVLHECSVVQQIAGDKRSAVSFGLGDVPGAGVTSMLPANCAVLVQKRTLLAGRKFRGRMYVPGIPGDSVSLATDCNTLTSAHLVSLQTAFDALFAELRDGTPGPVITPSILHPSPSTTVTPIAAFSVQARLATQRGRLRD